VREAAKEKNQERFRALSHHLSIDTLRKAFFALRREAAPGVDGLRWRDYEAELISVEQDGHGTALAHREATGLRRDVVDETHVHARRHRRDDPVSRGRGAMIAGHTLPVDDGLV
jgi:hypothetical protein